MRILPTTSEISTFRQDNFIFPDDERVVQYPFLLKLFHLVGRHGQKRVCGATLIDNNSAITAQHCIRG